MSKHLYLYEDEDLYALPTPDTLGILSSTREVVEQGEYVWIDTERINALAEQWAQEIPAHIRNDGQSEQPVWDDRYHFHDGTERTVNWLLVLDALNFCFWAEKKQPRWSIDYKGETLNGYWAEAAALTRAVRDLRRVAESHSARQLLLLPYAPVLATRPVDLDSDPLHRPLSSLDRFLQSPLLPLTSPRRRRRR